MQDNTNRKLGGGGVHYGKIFEKNVSTQGRTQEHFFSHTDDMLRYNKGFFYI